MFDTYYYTTHVATSKIAPTVDSNKLSGSLWNRFANQRAMEQAGAHTAVDGRQYPGWHGLLGRKYLMTRCIHAYAYRGEGHKCQHVLGRVILLNSHDTHRKVKQILRSEFLCRKAGQQRKCRQNILEHSVMSVIMECRVTSRQTKSPTMLAQHTDTYYTNKFISIQASQVAIVGCVEMQ